MYPSRAWSQLQVHSWGSCLQFRISANAYYSLLDSINYYQRKGREGISHSSQKIAVNIFHIKIIECHQKRNTLQLSPNLYNKKLQEAQGARVSLKNQRNNLRKLSQKTKNKKNLSWKRRAKISIRKKKSQQRRLKNKQKPNNPNSLNRSNNNKMTRNKNKRVNSKSQ